MGLSTRRLVCGFILAVTVWHLGWTVGATYAHDALYKHRLFNTRKMNGSWDRNLIPVAARFLKSNGSHRLVVFAGSSLTFGYSYSEKAIFSHHVAEWMPGASVLNLSSIGAVTPSIADALLCAMHLSDIRIDTLIFEIAVVNDASGVIRESVDEARGSLDGVRCDPFWHRLPAFSLAPFGLRWLWKMPDEYAGNFDPRPVILSPLPESYIADAGLYAAAAPRLSGKRRETIARLRDKVGTLIVFPSPIYVDGLEQLGFARANIERQMSDALEECRAVEGVICLDTRVFNSAPEMFINVTHLGLKGHRRLAEWLLWSP